jgi:PmbA protein
MSTTGKTMQELAETLVAYGRKKGASEVEVGIQEGAEFDVSVRDGEVESLTEAGSRDLTLRAFVDGKVATATSSDLNDDTLLRLVDNAIARARLAGTDPFAGLPERGGKLVSAEALGIFDPAVVAMSPEKKLALARETESIGRKDGRINRSLGASCSSNAYTQVLANSKGFSGSFRKTVLTLGVGFQCGKGEQLFQDYWYEGATSVAGLKAPEAIAKKAVQRTVRLLGASKVPTQNVPVVLEPSIAGNLFLRFLLQCISGASVDRKQSFLADKLGTRIASDLVTVVDDGLIPGAVGTSPFDGEGVPAGKTTFIEAGVLKTFMLNTYYARKLKLKGTGNAGGPNNLYLAPGKATPEAIVKSVDKGLLLTGILGHGRVPTTGDISVGAFGLWIEKGEVVHPVAEITISGNLGDLLKGVQAVGNDLELRFGVSCPTVKVAEMTVAGTSAT